MKISYAIDIKNNKKLLYKLIYSLSVRELQVLHDYIVSNIIKS